VILSEQGKTNAEGRIDQTGVLRHRDPSLCAVGAIALHLFSRFHLAKESRPNFEPRFGSDVVGSGGFEAHRPEGHRDWYALVLWSGNDSRKPMSYESKQFDDVYKN
jgi:hypothetical protein